MSRMRIMPIMRIMRIRPIRPGLIHDFIATCFIRICDVEGGSMVHNQVGCRYARLSNATNQQCLYVR